MLCPKCQFDHPSQTTECLKCGVVFSRYEAPTEVAATTHESIVALPANVTAVMPTVLPAAPIARNEALTEFKYRVAALPAALLLAYWAVGSALALPSGMLAMVLHESGHAITSWFTGRWAVPMLWLTMHGETRSWAVILFLSSAIIAGGFVAWKMERWKWVGVAGALLLLQIIFLNAPAPPGAMIVFGGDGGALVLGSLLMALFYTPHESKLYQNWGLRWGLLVIGALAFMHVFRLWTGPFENIPFGEIEGVNLSDPSLLTQMYGWPVPQLIARYIFLGRACLAVLAAIYIWGLISAYADVWSSAQARKIEKVAAA